MNAVMQLCLALLLCTKVVHKSRSSVGWTFRASEATCQGLAEPGETRNFRVKIQLENE